MTSVRLRVVSYNVRGLRADAAALARVLRDLDPDVVLVQELPTVLLWRGRAASFARRAGLLYTAGGGTTGGPALFTAIRVDLREVREHRLPGRRGRGVVLARLEKDGVAFGAASVQLGRDAGERSRHLTDLTALVDRLDPPALVLGGDGVFVCGAEVTSYRVVDTPDARAASAHLPVLAELTLPR